MRKPLLLLFSCFIHLLAAAQYWQQEIDYHIDVTLNDKEHVLEGFEKMQYTNHSPDTLHFIWMHLWPNAYKNDRTAFSDQMLLNGNTKFYFSPKEQRGYINRLDFKVNGVTAATEDHPQYIDVVRIMLPTPLAPGGSITITTPFHVQLPYNFSRGGHEGESYQVTQWYPKPAVYDAAGWHPIPYLDQGEFYSEFGHFDVQITVPKNYVVAATGELQDEEEKKWMAERENFTWTPLKEKIKSPGGSFKMIEKPFPASSPETKTLHYVQDRVHDFAWFADKRFIVNHDTCQLPSGKVIDVYSFYTPNEKPVWQKSLQYEKNAVRFYSSQVDEYPYKVLNVVQGPKSFGGGMEYPTITVISPTSSPRDLDVTIAHEIGHNWFYGILATNERDHPWMDEGINSFYEYRYAAMYYNDRPGQDRTFFETFAEEHHDQPIETTAENFQVTNYDLVAYFKTSDWLRWMEKELGSESFSRAMQDYYRDWSFKHPQPADFKASMEKSLGRNLDSYFAKKEQTGLLPNEQRMGTRIETIFSPHFYKNFLNNSDQNLITFSPAVGTNSYDKMMLGIFITNLKLPPNHFKFFLAPMYSMGAKKLVGLGKLDYSIFTPGLFAKTDLFINGSAFSSNVFTDTAGKNYYTGFRKMVPGIRLVFKEKDPRSTVRRLLQFKSFLISEDGLHFKRDTVITGIDTALVTRISSQKENRSLQQLEYVVENSRALYPYRGELKIEQSKGFVRASFTGNYFFNYPKGGGLETRFFAGKFFYTGAKTQLKEFATDRYHLDLTGPNGYEDYTYSDYFLGRNKFDGLESQQIMIRDGGFKVRTELLANKVGKTDDWLVAMNFATTIPSGINPLSLLPVKIPLKAFLDIGTQADAWKTGAEGDRFLFDAGLQISLLKNTVNIYIPLIYSKVYKDYIKSTLDKKGRFLKTISFNIDVANFSWKKIDRNIPF